MASQALGRCPACGECRPGLPCSMGPSPLSRAFLLPLPEAQGGFSLMFTVGPGRAPGALEEQAATWCGGHVSGTRRQPVRAQGGCRPVASGSGPANSLGHGGVAPKHWRLWMEAKPWLTP